MSQWAGIVFGRTYEVDYRFIAMPEDFTSEEKIWAENHIRVTTRNAEKLREHPPRWSVVKNQRLCLVGLTCMAYTIAENMTEDNKPRQLYVFVGYAARPPFRSLPPMDIELFSPLYEYVRQKWHEKTYDRSKEVPIPTEYKELVYSKLVKVPEVDDDYIELNQANPEIVRLWPDEDGNREKLWLAAESSERASLCLGLATQSDVLRESPFLNAIAADVRQRNDLPKSTPTTVQREKIERPAPEVMEPEPMVYRKSVEAETETESKENWLHPGEVLGTVAGGVMLAKFFGLPGFFLGSGIGLIAGGWAVDSGIGGTIKKRTEELLRGSSSSRKRANAEPEGMEGFRRKNQRNNTQNDDPN